MRDTYVPLDTMSESSQKKVIVIGDGAVGKTCFVSKVTENKFIPNYLPTLGGEISCIQTICEGPIVDKLTAYLAISVRKQCCRVAYIYCPRQCMQVHVQLMLDCKY